jgi:hypothetical protein
MRYKEFKRKFPKKFSICGDSVDFINSQNTFQEAFENCNNPNFLWNAVRLLCTVERKEFVNKIQTELLSQDFPLGLHSKIERLDGELFCVNWVFTALEYNEFYPTVTSAMKNHFPKRLKYGRFEI